MRSMFLLIQSDGTAVVQSSLAMVILAENGSVFVLRCALR